MIPMDYEALISRADLIYHRPTQDGVEGQPIGNGRMGTLVWTTPSAIHMQINRSDVFAANKQHSGAQYGPTDYCAGCAWVTLDVGHQAFVPSAAFAQRLSLYRAECSLGGGGVKVRCFVSSMKDVLVLELDDQRAQPQPLRLTLHMWRPPEVKTGEHTARYAFRAAEGATLVEQRFDERDYHCASAVAVQAVGRKAELLAPDETKRVLIFPAQAGKTLILISSAASWSPNFAVGEAALRLIQEAAGQSYETLQAEHARWWADFWSRTFVHCTSRDGLADFMERLRTLHLYIMASTSRGALPPKFNGLLFTTAGDKRAWGAQFWLWNTELLYFPLFAADALDLIEPYFRMYLKQLPDAEAAGRQRWGVEGAFFPETTPFDGPKVLPDDVAQEIQDVLLGRKPAWELSERAIAECSYESHLHVVAATRERGKPHYQHGRYTWISHILTGGCKLAVQAWWLYRYSGDKDWLRRGAYPLLRASVEFYRHFAKKGDDGRYHLYPTNVHERFWGVRDGIMDLAAIRGAVPLAIRAATLLGVDDDLCEKWREFLANLAPYPMGHEPASQALTGGVLAEDAWAAGHLGDVPGSRNNEQVWLTPVFPFEDYTLETADPATARIAQRTYELLPHREDLRQGRSSPIWSRIPILAARAGQGKELPLILASHYACQEPLPNGLSLGEGEQAQAIEHVAGIAAALQDGLLQSLSPRPGEPEVLRLFPAWPQGWEAEFQLLARGSFLVTSALRRGQIPFVEITSRRGEPCRLRNPWGRPAALLVPDGTRRELSGALLCFDTIPGGRYLLYPQDQPQPQPLKVAIQAAQEPVSYEFTLPNGKTVRGGLGRCR